jgi:hypothetical protein
MLGEAPSGFEPLIKLLQSLALPLGHGAPVIRARRVGTAHTGLYHKGRGAASLPKGTVGGIIGSSAIRICYRKGAWLPVVCVWGRLR